MRRRLTTPSVTYARMSRVETDAAPPGPTPHGAYPARTLKRRLERDATSPPRARTGRPRRSHRPSRRSGQAAPRRQSGRGSPCGRRSGTRARKRDPGSERPSRPRPPSSTPSSSVTTTWNSRDAASRYPYVQLGRESRVDELGLDRARGAITAAQGVAHALAQIEEAAQREDRDLGAAADDLIAGAAERRSGVLVLYPTLARGHAVAGNTDDHRAPILVKRPIEHREVLLAAHGGKAAQVGQRALEGEVEEAQVRGVARAVHGGAEIEHDGGEAVRAQVMPGTGRKHAA